MKKILLYILLAIFSLYGILHYIQYVEIQKYNKILSQEQNNVSKNRK